MAKQAGETEVLDDQALVDAFKWDEGDGDFFPSPEPKKTKTEKEQEVLDAVKGKKDGKGKEKEINSEEDGSGGDGDTEYEPFSESEYQEPDTTSKGGKGTESKGTKGETTTESSRANKPEEHGTLTAEELATKEEEEQTEFFTTLTKELKEKSILTLDLDDDEKITEEKFFELQEAEIQLRADEIFEDVFEQVKQDPDAVAFLKFKRAGGLTSEFFNTYRESTTFPDNLDLEKKENQRKVVKNYLQSLGTVDEEDVPEELEKIEEKGKLETLAKKHYKNINDRDIANRLKLVDEQEKRHKKISEDAVKTRDALQKIVIGGIGEANFKFTKEEQKDLVPYLTKPTIKIGANRFITPFQAELGEIMKDPKKLLTLAKIIKKKFDVPELAKAVETKVINKVKSGLIAAKENKTRSTTSAEKSLADMFSD